MPASEGKIAGTAVVIDRCVALLKLYLNGHLAEVDANANALAATPGDETDFATPPLDINKDIQPFMDAAPNRVLRVVVTELNREDLREADQDEEGTGTTLPRYDREHQILFVCFSRMRTNESRSRAWRECDRLAEAVRMTLDRYPGLTLPTAARMAVNTRLILDERPAEDEDDEIFTVRRRLAFGVRRIETR